MECIQMDDIPTPTPEPTIITVGELKAELSRWQESAAVAFRCPLRDQELRFYRIQSLSKDVVQIELNQYPETPPVLPSGETERSESKADG
jgi:hypothetical protein